MTGEGAEAGADEFMPKPSSGLKFGEVVEGLQRRWLGSAGLIWDHATALRGSFVRGEGDREEAAGYYGLGGALYKSIADAGFGADEVRLGGVGLQLLAQTCNVNPQVVRLFLVVGAPNLAQDLTVR